MQIDLIKKEHIGEAFRIFILKKKFSFLIVFVLKVSQHLLFKTIKRLLLEYYLELIISKKKTLLALFL